MSRKTLIVALSLSFLAGTAVLADSNVPKQNTRAAIKAYVESAAKYIAKNGARCEEFAEKDWRSGDYYIFVDGPDNKTLCHPNASLIGKDNDTIKDVNGKSVGALIRAAASKEGGGWAEYMWPRPGTDKPVAKSTYAVEVKGPDGKTYVVGAGGYELK